LKTALAYLKWEFRLLKKLRVVVALGGIAFDSCVHLLGFPAGEKFSHGAILRHGDLYLISSYHPSRRNTQTGLLKPEMLDSVFIQAKKLSGI